MDENKNKDFAGQEQTPEAENPSIEDTTENNTAEENTANEEATEEAEITEEAAQTNPEENQAKPVKSKRFIQIPVLIAAAILVCALLVFGVMKLFFDNSIVGEWIVEGSVATSDEISEDDAAAGNTYYIFTDDTNENGEKVAKLRVGTMELIGTYSISNNTDGTRALTVSISYFFAGTYNYTVSGNAFTGKVLTLESDSGNVSFNCVKAPKLQVAVSDDFKAKDDIVGSWKESDYDYTYTFNADGTTHIDEGGTLTVDGTYVADDKKIVITYLASEETTLEIEYSLDGDTLVLNGLGYTKVTE